MQSLVLSFTLRYFYPCHLHQIQMEILNMFCILSLERDNWCVRMSKRRETIRGMNAWRFCPSLENKKWDSCKEWVGIRIRIMIMRSLFRSKSSLCQHQTCLFIPTDIGIQSQNKETVQSVINIERHLPAFNEAARETWDDGSHSFRSRNSLIPSTFVSGEEEVIVFFVSNGRSHHFRSLSC